jgi:flagellin
MTNSINTNVGALVALRNLNSVNSDLNSVQSKVSTGLRVSTAQEDASIFAVAQGIRSNIGAFEAVNGALNGAKGILSVSISASTSISDTLANVREKLTQLSDESITAEQRTIYSTDLRAQIDQIRNFLDRAIYNGKNLVKGTLSTSATTVDVLTGTYYSSAADVRVIQDIAGNSLTIRSADLLTGGNTSGTSGWLGLARLVYNTSATYVGTNAASTAASDTSPSNFAALATATGAGASRFIARSFVTAAAAQAALADTTAAGTRQTGVYFSTATATAGIDSVFNSAYALFNREISLVLGTQGADNRSLELQVKFNTAVNDATTEGLGNLVDADLARESARLQALQTKQQLSIQTLSIANQAPSVLLGLFR